MIFAYTDNNNSGTKLWDTVIRSVQQFNMRYISQLLDGCKDVISVFIKTRVKKSSYIFKHYGSWLNFLNQSNCFGEKISFVFLSKLLACN